MKGEARPPITPDMFLRAVVLRDETRPGVWTACRVERLRGMCADLFPPEPNVALWEHATGRWPDLRHRAPGKWRYSDRILDELIAEFTA